MSLARVRCWIPGLDLILFERGMSVQIAKRIKKLRTENGFEEELFEVDPDMDLIVRFEEQRQARKLILIPSESICPRAIRKVLGSGLKNKDRQENLSSSLQKVYVPGLFERFWVQFLPIYTPKGILL